MICSDRPSLTANRIDINLNGLNVKTCTSDDTFRNFSSCGINGTLQENSKIQINTTELSWISGSSGFGSSLINDRNCQWCSCGSGGTCSGSRR